MRLRSFALMLATCGLLHTALEARGVRRLQPSGKCVVDYAADTCRLAREFGEGEQRVTLLFEQFVPGDVFNLTFVGRSMASAISGKATIRFGPNELADQDNTVTLITVGSQPGILLGVFQRLAPVSETERAEARKAAREDRPYENPPIGTVREKAATWLELKKVLPFDLVLETGPMDHPLEALRQCSWDTVKSWGLAIEEQKGLTRHARSVVDPRNWFNSNDYPTKMLNQGYEGNVNFRVIVDANGLPITCHVQSSTRPQEFDDIVCRQIMKKAKFKPALDANGKPIKSYYRQSVHFRLAH